MIFGRVQGRVDRSDAFLGHLVAATLAKCDFTPLEAVAAAVLFHFESRER